MNHFNPDVTNILFDPDLGAQSVVVHRSRLAWDEDEKQYKQVTIKLNAYGNLQPASIAALSQFPEGDRINGMIVFRTTTQIHLSGDITKDTLSDEIEWQGRMYKVMQINPWLDYGFNVVYLARR